MFCILTFVHWLVVLSSIHISPSENPITVVRLIPHIFVNLQEIGFRNQKETLMFLSKCTTVLFVVTKSIAKIWSIPRGKSVKRVPTAADFDMPISRGPWNTSRIGKIEHTAAGGFCVHGRSVLNLFLNSFFPKPKISMNSKSHPVCIEYQFVPRTLSSRETASDLARERHAERIVWKR